MPNERRISLALAPVVGVLVGLAMSGVRYVVIEVLWQRLEPHTALGVIVVPFAGLAVSGLLLQFAARDAESHDTEAYIARYHRPSANNGSTVVKVIAAMATVGFGGAAGLEGPAVHAGSEIGRKVQSLFTRTLTDRRTLLAAGAAAGVSAVFKTPLTGVLFALEVPFKDDVARGALIPSALASVASYLVAVALTGAEPLFPVVRQFAPDTRTVLLSLLLGLVVGVIGRLFVMLLGIAKRLSELMSPPLALRAAGGGLACGLFGLASLLVLGAPLALGPGYGIIDATVAGRISGLPSLWLFLFRSGAVLATLASGVAGGSFFPLLSLGAAAGSVLEPLAPQAGSLMPLVGMAAFLSAGYGIPLTAAVFVAESTGAPGYIIPGLLGASVAYVVAGRRTLSHLQRPRATAGLEAMLRRPVASLMTVDVVAVPPETSVAAFIADFVVGYRRKSFPVVDSGRLVGMIALTDVQQLAEEEWATTEVRDVMVPEVVVALPTESAAEVLSRMNDLDIDRVPVVDSADTSRLAGIISTTDLRPALG